MAKSFLIAVLTLLNYIANAHTYYFSSAFGDDNRTSEAAQNPSTPWRTIDKLNSFHSALQPGDNVLFKRGEIFYGSIQVVNLNGTTSNQITFGAYGSGSKPIISGLRSISNWSNIGNGIYEKSLIGQVTSSINMVTFQDTLQPIGRWPKTNTVGAGYLPFQSHSATSSITSNKISSAPNFTGGELVTRAWGWIINRAKVISQTSNVIRYTPLPSRDLSTFTYEPIDGFGFFFQNHINALTRLGDWMYDVNTNKFRMYFGSQIPNNYSVNVAIIDNLVNLNWQHDLTFDGLSFKGANANCFNIDNSNNIVIKNCDISLSGIDGIFVPNSNSGNITIKNCAISNTNNNALTANSSPGWIIQNNIINNTGLNRGMGLSGDGQYIAINHVGSNSLVEYNDIRNTGYNGIEFDGDNTIIRNNFIDSFCVVKSDGGGIYNSAERDKRGRRVVGNIILNGIGDRFGRSQDEIDDPLAGNVHGIYMDGGASYVTIESNTVANCGNSGIELSSPIFVQVLNNTFYNNKVTQIYYWESKGPISNLTLKNNIAFSKSSEQLISLINADNDNERTWGIMDSNYYCRPASEPIAIDTLGYSHSPEIFDYPDGGIIGAANNRFYSLDKWKTLSGRDKSTNKTPDNHTDLSKILFEYNKTNNPKTISLNGLYFDVKNRFFNNTITIAPYSSVILMKKSDPINQTINFASLNNKILGDPPITLNATSSSGLPVRFTIVSGPATIDWFKLTLTGTGIVSIRASQSGNAQFNPAEPVIRNFTVSARLKQTITFMPILAKTLGDPPVPLIATASSGLPVSFIIASGPGNIIGNKISLTGTGTVKVIASQLGNSQFDSATSVTQNFIVSSKLNQSLTFQAIQNKTIGDPPFILDANSSSGLPVNFKIVSGPANLIGNKIILTGAGIVEIEATQPGNTQYNASVPITQKFTVSSKQNQTITFQPLQPKTFGDPSVTLTASASSGLPVSFTITSGPAIVIDNKIILTDSGMVVVKASQRGNIQYNPSVPVIQSFRVSGKSNQTIIFQPLQSKIIGEGPIVLSATSSSGLAVKFKIISGPAILIDNKVAFTGIGIVVITASQPGNAQFNPAPIITQNFSVLAKMNQSIIFQSLQPKIIGDPDFTISGTASSGLPLHFRIVSGPAILNQNKISINGTGTVVVEASQPGNVQYNPALSVIQNFSVSGKINQTIIFQPISISTLGNPPITLKATASSGLSVGFKIISGPAIINGNILTLTGPGRVVVEATQNGNFQFYPAVAVIQSFKVIGINKAIQTITFNTIKDKFVGDPPFTPQSASTSGLPLKFRVLMGQATINANKISFTGIGPVIVEASQDGNEQFEPAIPVTQSFQIFAANTINKRIYDTITNKIISKQIISVYSNPFNNEISIQINPEETGEGSIKLYDFQGKLMKQMFMGKLEKDQNKIFHLNTQGLSEGVYIVTLANKIKVVSQKVFLNK